LYIHVYVTICLYTGNQFSTCIARNGGTTRDTKVLRARCKEWPSACKRAGEQERERASERESERERRRERESVCARERERERERERPRQRERESERKKEGERERESETERDKERERARERERESLVCMLCELKTESQTKEQAGCM